MSKVVEITPSHMPAELRFLAARSKDANQSRRLLSIAAALDGMSRAEAARIGGMDRQTLRDWAEPAQGSDDAQHRWKGRRRAIASTRRALTD